jgi:hypothetical protein
VGGFKARHIEKSHRHCLKSPSIWRQELDIAIRIGSVPAYVFTFPLTSPAASAIFFDRQEWSRHIGAGPSPGPSDPTQAV